MQDKIRVCQWGAFDVANYGDRLFPLIAREQLTARLPSLELVCHAPVGHATLPPGSPPLFPLVPGGGSLDRERREYFARHFDALLIGGGDYFVGSSLHGNLTALSFGIPHVVVNNPLRAAKLEGFVQLAGMEDFRITNWESLEETFDRLAASPRERWSTAADRLKARASEHFDRLAELISRAAEERRKPAGKARPAKPRGDIPFEVYDTIAGLPSRRPAARAARRATEKELRDSKEILRDRHLAHKARLKRSEDQNERLEAEMRTLRARNESLEERLQSIENSVTWRLLGPYRRLRSVVDALMRPASDDGTRDDDTAGSR